jgi:hypothetical protein
MAFQRIRPAIYGIILHSLVLDIYSPISSPLLIQLILRNFYDLPLASFHFSTMCRRSELSCVVGCMDKCSLTPVIYLGSGCALTTPSMRHITSLTEMLLVNFVPNLGFALSFNHNRQHHIQFDICQ